MFSPVQTARLSGNALVFLLGVIITSHPLHFCQLKWINCCWLDRTVFINYHCHRGRFALCHSFNQYILPVVRVWFALKYSSELPLNRGVCLVPVAHLQTPKRPFPFSLNFIVARQSSSLWHVPAASMILRKWFASQTNEVLFRICVLIVW